MSEDIFLDTETDGLLDTVTKVHMLQIGAVGTDEVTIYCDEWPGCLPVAEGLERIRNARRVIGHNMISFDYEIMARFFPGVLRREQVVDTLVMARLKDPEERSNSLDAIGQRLGVLKGSFKGPWDKIT